MEARCGGLHTCAKTTDYRVYRGSRSATKLSMHWSMYILYLSEWQKYPFCIHWSYTPTGWVLFVQQRHVRFLWVWLAYHWN